MVRYNSWMAMDVERKKIRVDSGLDVLDGTNDDEVRSSCGETNNITNRICLMPYILCHWRLMIYL